MYEFIVAAPPILKKAFSFPSSIHFRKALSWFPAMQNRGTLASIRSIRS